MSCIGLLEVLFNLFHVFLFLPILKFVLDFVQEYFFALLDF